MTAIVAIAVWRIEGPLRRYLERRVNESLTGYTVSIGALDLHPLSLTVELEEVTMVQDQRPTPPVLYLPSWRTNLEWRSLLSLALVADTRFERPKMFITLEQTEQETEDKTKLSDRGWQDALQAVYPLKINTFRIVDGTISYYDVGRVPPLEFEHVDFRATNIRNVRFGARDLSVSNRSSRLRCSAARSTPTATRISSPSPTPHSTRPSTCEKANIAPMGPMVRRFDLVVSKGLVGASGRLVLETKQTTVGLDRVVLSGPSIEYVRDPRPQERQVEKAVVLATEAATAPGVRVDVKDVKIENGTFALKVDALRSADGKMLYADAKDLPPLRARACSTFTPPTSIASGPPASVPTRFELRTNILGDGTLGVKGTADLLAEPQPTTTADFDLRDIRLDPFAPLARRWAFELSGGTLAADGRLDVTKTQTALVLHRVAATNPSVTYAKKTAKDEERLERATRAATTGDVKPAFRLDVEDASIRGGTFAYAEESSTPPYRLALTHADLGVRGFSNEQAKRRGSATLRGRFMESGNAAIDATFASGSKQPEFDMDVRLERVQLVELNDLLRATGGFDVTAGTFSFYSEMAVKDGRVHGYVKPFFDGLDVYDRKQDKDKPITKQAYEVVVGAAGSLLENRRSDKVATEAELSGPIENPDARTWQIVSGLLRNAFWRSLMPGLDAVEDRALTGRRG